MHSLLILSAFSIADTVSSQASIISSNRSVTHRSQSQYNGPPIEECSTTDDESMEDDSTLDCASTTYELEHSDSRSVFSDTSSVRSSFFTRTPHTSQGSNPFGSNWPKAFWDGQRQMGRLAEKDVDDDETLSQCSTLTASTRWTAPTSKGTENCFKRPLLPTPSQKRSPVNTQSHAWREPRGEWRESTPMQRERTPMRNLRQNIEFLSLGDDAAKGEEMNGCERDNDRRRSPRLLLR